jgi:uncharacterized protein (TIGR02598 family)
MTARHFPFHRRRERAFSLVEVTLALGIMAIAFIPIFGMLPVGMQTYRDSADKTQTIRITQKLLAEAQQTPFDKLSTLYSEVTYYDDEGEEIIVTSGGEPPNYIYSAMIEPVSENVSNNNTSTVGISSTSTQMVLIKVAKNKRVDKLTQGEKPMVQIAFALADVRL